MTEWFWNAIGARLGWMAVDVAMIIGVGLLLLLPMVPKFLKQARCRHERFFETGSCDAVCSLCGKNLGFIGAVRESRKALSEPN